MGLRRRTPRYWTRTRWYWTEPTTEGVLLFAASSLLIGILAAIGSMFEGLWWQAVWMVLGFSALAAVALLVDL